MALNKQKRAGFILLLCILNLLQTGVVLAFAQEEPVQALHSKELKAGVSAVLDSPEPLFFRQITPFITENFGIRKLEDLDEKKPEEEEEIPVWHIRERLKKSAQETEELAKKYAHTPDDEQYTLAIKLTEYEKGFDSQSPQKPAKNIVSIDLLRELQFLNRDHNSILKAISRLTTKGGDIAMTALIAKCSDNLDVIKQRRAFIKTLIDNPTLLNKLQDQLDIIKEAEPLFFSNFSNLKRDRLSVFIKGGLIKAFFKYMWPKSYRAERMATNTELVYKPVFSMVISGILSGLSLFDLGYTFWTFDKNNGLSNIGNTIKSAVDFGGKWPVLKVPQQTIHHYVDKWSWNDFMENEILKEPSINTGDKVQQAKQAHKDSQKGKWFKKSFLKKMREAFDDHYTTDGATPDAANNFFAQNDADKKSVSEKIKKLRKKQVEEANLPDLPEPATGSPGEPADPFDTKYPGAPTWRKTCSKELVRRLHGIRHENKIYNYLAFVGVVGLFVFMIPQIEMAYKSYMDNYLDLKNLFNSVQAPHTVYKAGQEMHKLLSQPTETKGLYPDFIPSTSKQWLSFLELVQSDTFATSFSPMTMGLKDHGKVVQAYHLLMQSQEEMGELIRFYGELDAYVSMAKLVQEFEDSNNNEGTPIRYSFVEFDEESHYPRFDALHYWNPMFAPKRAIPNIINVGEDGKARNIIVTGANAGGKSGNIKAILTNIILAQTFGIAPAEQLKMTVFSFIQATLKSNDDTAGGKSRFQVEALDMARVMQRVIALPKDKFCAIFSDELFAGTEVEPAIALTKRICLSIAGMDNVMYILATHYKDLTKLEIATNGIFKNFKVEVIKLPDGTLFRPYRLIEGIGGTNIAFDVFIEQLGELGIKDGYLHEMVRQAKADQTTQELLNPHKTLGIEASFSNRNSIGS